MKGFARDFSIDSMPKGYVWDLVDYIPDTRGAQLEGRAPWTYMSPSALAGTVWGGYDAIFRKGHRLLVWAGDTLYEQMRNPPYTTTALGTLFPQGNHNGRMLQNRLYFAGTTGSDWIKRVTYDGSTPAPAGYAISDMDGANAPRATVLAVHKGRLIGGGDDAHPERIYFSPLQIDGGPNADWDELSYIDSSQEVTALGVLPNQIIVFHNGTSERIRGSIPPGTDIDTDMDLDSLSAQGCIDPASVVNWQENLIFANKHGIHLTDGSSLRCLTDQGGIGPVWQATYAAKRLDSTVCCGVYGNLLFATILADWTSGMPRDLQAATFVCDLGNRSWFRFSNMKATAMIPAGTIKEELWWGVDGANRLAFTSPMLAGLPDMDPDFPGGTFPDAADEDGTAILPRMTTGFVRFGPEGQKRMRHLYVSHETPTQTAGGNVLNVGYRLSPVISDSFVQIGGLPASTRYDRKRLPVGRPGYGIQVHVEQTRASHATRLYDIAVESWVQDRGKVS